MWRYVMIVIAALLISLSAGAVEKDSGFQIRRGTNISHWLSQSTRRGQERAEFFTEKDVEFSLRSGSTISGCRSMRSSSGTRRAIRSRRRSGCCTVPSSWAQKSKLRVVVDLHILRSHHFNAQEKPLWTDPKAQDKFIALWRELSAELGKYPALAGGVRADERARRGRGRGLEQARREGGSRDPPDGAAPQDRRSGRTSGSRLGRSTSSASRRGTGTSS